MEKYHLVERISAEQLNTCLDELASRINRDYEGKELVLIGVLKGAFIFLADLARRLSVPAKIDFVRLASYGDKTESSGCVTMTKPMELSIKDAHVIIVEDIVDSGITLKWFLDHIGGLGAASVRICALIDKLERREVELPLDYVGMRLDSGFLVGYGLDFSEKFRNLPAIHEVVFEDAPLRD